MKKGQPPATALFGDRASGGTMRQLNRDERGVIFGFTPRQLLGLVVGFIFAMLWTMFGAFWLFAELGLEMGYVMGGVVFFVIARMYGRSILIFGLYGYVAYVIVQIITGAI